MKGVAVFITLCVLVASPAGATAPDTWNEGMLIGEAAAGLGLGAVLLVTAARWDNDDDGTDWPAISGWAAGNAGGVILVGELFDGRSANWYVTYPVTLVGASVIPFTAVAIAKGSDLDFGEGFLAALVIALGTPVVTTITYNLVKCPVYDTSAARGGVDVQPYATLLADDGAGCVPVYGLSAAF
jgi:hypothetical protein